MKKSRQSLYRSFEVAFKGIGCVFKEERNIKIHSISLITVIGAGFLFRISPIEWCICLGISGSVIGAELINSAIETIVDIIMPDIDPRAKRAKDIAAGAVLVFAISAAIIGGIIFVPKIFA